MPIRVPARQSEIDISTNVVIILMEGICFKNGSRTGIFTIKDERRKTLRA